MMDFVNHLLRTSQKHDAVWVIVNWLTKLAHFFAVWITFTPEEFCRLYLREIVRLHGVLESIVSNWDPRFTTHFWGEFPASHGDTVDDEHSFSSSDGRLVRVDHPNVRGHAMGMCPRSQG